MKGVALKPAFFNGSLVKEGDVVEVPEGFKASWFAPHESAAAKAAKPQKPPAKPEPKALSEIGNEKATSFVAVNEGKVDLA